MAAPTTPERAASPTAGGRRVPPIWSTLVIEWVKEGHIDCSQGHVCYTKPKEQNLVFPGGSLK